MGTRTVIKLLDSKTVNVTIEDPNNGKIFDKRFAAFRPRNFQR